MKKLVSISEVRYKMAIRHFGYDRTKGHTVFELMDLVPAKANFSKPNNGTTNFHLVPTNWNIFP